MTMERETVHLQVVFGPKDVDWLNRFLLPSLRGASEQRVVAWCMNYAPENANLVAPSGIELMRLTSETETRQGFGANHNALFGCRGTSDDFVILNPDCVLRPGSIDRLIECKTNHQRAAIIEGRQWPFEHPKEFDFATRETPWASGCFALLSGEFFAESGGFDDAFFLYLEDVDLSWRAWMNGWRVIYCLDAVAIHHSGGPFYRRDVLSAEEYFGGRNFLVLLRKHFGEEGERRGYEIVRKCFPSHVAEQMISSFESGLRDSVPLPAKISDHHCIKVLDFNQFHEVRS